MLKRLSPIIFTALAVLFIIGCASRGRPSGGEKDTEPPIILKEVPKNFSTYFDSDEIRIYFDEYVKIKDIQKQLIISPPLSEKPTIYPLGGASKSIVIKIKDTLLENTTYAFNFGQSIVDNHEENPFPYYRYVFSTGPTIDSLSIKGYVTDALLKVPENFVSVMLYDIDSTYTDSIVYKETPRYITNTLDSATTFSIENIKEGRYKLVALKDKNSNYLFNQKQEKIAFYDDIISVSNDTSANYKLRLFKEETNFRAIKPKQEGETKLIFPYEGDYKDLKIKVLENKPNNYSYTITKDPETDTLYYWYKPKFEVDTTFFLVSNKKSIDSFKHRFRNLEKDTLSIAAVSSATLNFNEDYTINATTPVIKIDESKIKIIDKDSTSVAFKVEHDTLLNYITLKLDKAEAQKYDITILPDTFEDFYNTKNQDTLHFSFRTKQKSEYGNMRVNLRNAQMPLIVQLVDDKSKVIYEKYADKTPVVDFFDIIPKTYDLRVIFDSNKNQRYDTGNFLLGQQPERVSYYPNLDQVRANFDQVIDFKLLDE